MDNDGRASDFEGWTEKEYRQYVLQRQQRQQPRLQHQPHFQPSDYASPTSITGMDFNRNRMMVSYPIGPETTVYHPQHEHEHHPGLMVGSYDDGDRGGFDPQEDIDSIDGEDEYPRLPPAPQQQTVLPSYRSNHYAGDSSGPEDDEDNASTSQDPQQTTDRYGFFTDGPSPKTELVVSVGTLRKREMKWIHMLDNWSLFMNKRFHKVKERCYKGIPPAIRGRAWKYLSGAAYHMQNLRSQNAFEQLDGHPGEPRWIDDINKDLNRQFPEHELFSREGPYGKLGQNDLFRLLKAYTVLHPEEGYCQGQAPVAATLLMHMPLKDAFYCFVQICHKYLPGYYSPGLEAIQLDGDILSALLKRKSPATFKHLTKNKVDPVLYMVEWFMCIYCRTLPWSTVLRVWDIFFCEGVKVLFKIALIMFKYSLGSKEQLKACPEMYEIVERLRNLPPHVMEEGFLISRLEEVKLDEEQLEKMHYKQFKKRLQKKTEIDRKK